MTRPAADRVKVIWTGTGTGTMTLGAAVPGEPVSAVPSTLDGHVVRYLIKHETANEAEAGYGVYTHSGTTLTRAYRTYPTLGGSAVAFSSGTKHVSLTNVHLDLVPNIATVDPVPSDSIATGYLMGHTWINTTTDTVWICVDHQTGSADWRQIDSVLLGQYDISARLASGSGVGTGIAASDLTDHTTPVAGDFLLAWAGGTTLRKINIANLPTVGDAAPTRVPSNASPFPLATNTRLHSNVIIESHQASVVFEVPQAATANSEWRIMPDDDGCTVTINGGVGTLTPSPARLVNGGLAIVTVVSNPGSAPVVQVRGEVITPSTSVTTKTYDADDHGQDFSASGTQTFGAAANFPNGFYVNIWNTTAGNITIDGADADHTIPAHGVAMVKKRGDGALVANGSGGDTVIDAA